ncbi:MAG: chitobiase/beta-hexosaminidase C-terminal domain-containing protein [candidate division WOR-3 bacterium]|nr:MAG: chitobiase/beta-hexosaminidase C-terminal domain-containing protein [candidate division WOR-3 bacterium]
MKYGKLIFWMLLVSASLYSQSEEDKISVATYRTIYSDVLDEERTIAVALPIGYAHSDKLYPVFYMLDAEYASFASEIGLVHFLSEYQIPEMLIVGVLNTNRNRDMWSHEIEGLSNTSDNGADNFMNFFAEELIPFIDQNYRTTKHRTIYGRSGAGHFVTYCLLANPDLFDDYLVSSPVIGFSDNQLLTRAEDFFQTHTSLPKSFYIYYGDTDYNSVVERIPRLETIIRDNTPEGFKWGVKRVAGGHGPPESLYELLRLLYSDWTPVARPVITPSKGELLEGDSIIVHIDGSHDPILYTLNGDEPTRNSTRYSAPITIFKSTTIKAKSIRGDLQEGSTSSAEFLTIDKHRTAQNVTDLKPGLKYTYFEKQTFNIPDNIPEPPKKAGIAPSIDIGLRERDQFYILQFDGFIKIPQSGRYRLTIISNASIVFLDDQLISSDHGLEPTEKIQEICLEKGFHSIRIISSVLTEQIHQLDFFWEGPGITTQKIPASALYHQ